MPFGYQLRSTREGTARCAIACLAGRFFQWSRPCYNKFLFIVQNDLIWKMKKEALMKKRIVLFSWFGIFFVLIMACSLPIAVSTSTPMIEVDPTFTSAAVIEIDATLTSIAFTQTALQGLSTLQQATALPSATLLPTRTSTQAPSVPVVMVSVDTYCRAGPGANFNFLTGLLVGEQAEVIGKYTVVNPPYWIIKKGATTCWLWGQYATVQGDTSALPEMVSPPTPTPSATSTSTPTATATSTQTSTPVPAPKGDLILIEFFQLTNHNISIRVQTNPAGSLSGSYVYTIWADGVKVKESVCAIPTGIELCDTGYAISGTQVIEVVIDTNNLIWETNEANNIMFLTCAMDFSCN